jgi:hypothetical protein
MENHLKLIKIGEDEMSLIPLKKKGILKKSSQVII